MNHITLIGDDRAWNATYTVEGGQVCVSSAYGGKRAPIGNGVEPEAVALAVFEAIIKKRPGMQRAKFSPGQVFRSQGR